MENGWGSLNFDFGRLEEQKVYGKLFENISASHNGGILEGHDIADLMLKELAPDTPAAKIDGLRAQNRLITEDPQTGELLASQNLADRGTVPISRENLNSTDKKTNMQSERLVKGLRVHIRYLNGQEVTRVVNIRFIPPNQFTDLIRRIIQQRQHIPDIENRKMKALKRHPISDKKLPTQPIRKSDERSKVLAEKISLVGTSLTIRMSRGINSASNSAKQKQEHLDELKKKEIEISRENRKKAQGTSPQTKAGILPGSTIDMSTNEALQNLERQNTDKDAVNAEAIDRKYPQGQSSVSSQVQHLNRKQHDAAKTELINDSASSQPRITSIKNQPDQTSRTEGLEPPEVDKEFKEVMSSQRLRKSKRPSEKSSKIDGNEPPLAA